MTVDQAGGDEGTPGIKALGAAGLQLRWQLRARADPQHRGTFYHQGSVIN
jgi:hypothetical protein